MGHPYAPYANRPKMEGTLLWSASTGIISQVGTTFLQTDAALNPKVILVDLPSMKKVRL